MYKHRATNWDEVPVIMDIPYAARLLGRTPENLKTRCQKGEFPAFKDGKLWRIEKETLRAYIEANSVMSSSSQTNVE